MPRVYVSIGSNVDRADNIRAGVRALRARYGDVTVSSVYDSKAVGFDGDDFYNLVACFETPSGVYEVVQYLRDVEQRQGRVRARRGDRFVSRTLDIDLLLYDDLIMDDGTLQLPRAEILQYAFVLAPLAEIAGADRHPVLKRRFNDLWADFVTAGEPPKAIDFDWTGLPAET